MWTTTDNNKLMDDFKSKEDIEKIKKDLGSSDFEREYCNVPLNESDENKTEKDN